MPALVALAPCTRALVSLLEVDETVVGGKVVLFYVNNVSVCGYFVLL